MNIYHVEPLVGIGPVRLGMHRDEVRRVMNIAPESFRKVPSDRYDADAFYGSAFQVFYEGDEPAVDYIELSAGDDFVAVYKGINVFSTPVDDLVALISVDSPVDESDPEFGYAFVFPELELSLWRPVMPESPDDPEGRYSSTVGIGVQGYYSNLLGT